MEREPLLPRTQGVERAENARARILGVVRYKILLTACCARAVWCIGIFGASVAVIVVRIKNGEHCGTLLAWIVTHGGYQLFPLYVALRDFSVFRQAARDGTEAEALQAATESEARKALGTLDTVLFILGVLAVNNKDCASTAPVSFRYVTAVLLTEAALAILPLVFICAVICFLPCLLCIVSCLAAIASRREREATRQRLDRLGTIKFSRGVVPPDDALCAICRSEYEEGEDLRRLACGHHFHAPCLDQWLLIRPECPLCKRRLDGLEPDPEAGPGPDPPPSSPARP